MTRTAYKILNAEKYAKPKEVNTMERTNIITEYTVRRGDGDNIVGMGRGRVQNILPCHPLVGQKRSQVFAIFQ